MLYFLLFFLDKIAFLGIFMIKTNTCSIYEQTFNKNVYLTGHACMIDSKVKILINTFLLHKEWNVIWLLAC